MTPQLIYISSPYTKGDCASNVRMQIDAAAAIMDLGHIPVVPNLTFLVQLVHPRLYEEWIQMYLHLVARCDFVLRLGGESPGADREVAHASSLGIPVARSFNQLEEMLLDKEERRVRVTYPE